MKGIAMPPKPLMSQSSNPFDELFDVNEDEAGFDDFVEAKQD